MWAVADFLKVQVRSTFKEGKEMVLLFLTGLGILIVALVVLIAFYPRLSPNWRHQGGALYTLIYLISALLLSVIFILSMLLALALAITATAYLAKPFCEPSLHLWAVDFLKDNHSYCAWLISGVRDTVNSEGQDALRTSSTIIASATLLVTVGLLVVNRAFTESIETVKTIGGCHERYFTLLGDWEKEKSRKMVHAFAGYYHCEFHYYVRGLLPTDVYSVWMHSWIKWVLEKEASPLIVKDAAKPTEKATLFEVFTEEVASVGDSDFDAFYKALFKVVQGPGAPTEGTLSDLAYVKSIAHQTRRQWRRKRYGPIFSFLICLIDRDDRADR